ncbi:unnamed protein product, partial [Cuscuta epithymum]
MGVAFFYLGVKRKQFNLKQKFATADPLLIGLIKTKAELLENENTTLTEAAYNGTIMNNILGTSQVNMMPWADADYVYIPLNTAMHWVLLVLEINEKRIRVYDSMKRRGDTVSSIRSYTKCLETFLPKVMERLGVYDKRQQAAIGKGKLKIEMVRNCPQQEDG